MQPMNGVVVATDRAAVSSAVAAAVGRIRRSAAPFISPLFLLIVFGFNIPILLIFNYSISSPHGFTLATYQDILITPVFLKVIGNTFRITIITTAVVATLGYVLAYWITGLTPRLRNAALAMVVLSFWVSVLVRTYAWIVVLGNAGLVNRLLQWSGLRDAPVTFLYNDLGVIIGMANIQLPLLVLPLYAAMTRVDPRHMQAAASLGASDRVIFWKVFFPQTVPALLSGIMLVVILCLGFYVTPAILGGGRVPMVANMLDTYINSIPKWELASAVSMVLLIFTLILFGIYRRLDARAGGEA
jgi:ABC-type spermidine/putrescine transport system permease subunit I